MNSHTRPITSCGLVLLFMVLLPRLSFLNKGIELESRQRYQQYYGLRKMGEEKKYAEALREYRQFIQGCPDFYDAQANFASLAEDADKLTEAVDYFQKLILERPDKPNYYYGLGLCYKRLKDFDKASQAFKKAIESGAAPIRVYYELLASINTPEDSQELIDYFVEQSRLLTDNALCYYGKGAIFGYKLRDYDAALANYQKGVAAARATGNALAEGQILNLIGHHYWNRSNLRKAQDYFLQAVQAIQHSGDKEEWARYLYNVGLMHCYLGDPKKGREVYHQALDIDQQIGNKAHEAQILRSIGFTYYQISQYAQAMTFYQKALEAARAAVDTAGEFRYMMDIGLVYWERGGYAEAVATYRESLTHAQNRKDQNAEYEACRHLGNAYWTMGNYSLALEFYLQSLDISKSLDHKLKESFILNNIANVYYRTGHTGKALEYYNESLAILREAGAKPRVGICLNNIANIYFQKGNYPLAMDCYQQALEIARESGNKKMEANRMRNLANCYARSGSVHEAEKYFHEALKIAKTIGAKELEAKIYENQGHLFLSSNHLDQAHSSFSEALRIAQHLGLPAIVWPAYAGLGSVLEKQNRSAEAINFFRQAIDVIEDIRSQITLEEHKSGFLAGKIKVYESLINLLVEQNGKYPVEGFDKEAFHFMERAKARAFLDSLGTGDAALRSNLSAVLREDESKLTKAISSIQTELVVPGLSPENRQRLLKKLEKAEENYAYLVQKIRRQSAQYAQLIYPEPYGLEDIQRRLPDNETALIEYFIGEVNSFVFCLTQDKFIASKMVPDSDLQEKVTDYIKLLSARSDREFTAHAAGHRLYRDLMGPVEDIFKKRKNLIIIPDSALNYLPFETLILSKAPEQNRFLIEDFNISYAPSSSSLLNILERQRPASQQKELLAFANPEYIFENEKRSEIKAEEILREFYLEQGFDFSPLVFSEKEVKSIAKLFKKKLRDINTKDKAKEEYLKEVSLADYKIIHFATHGLIDDRVPHRSAVILSLDDDSTEDGFFQAREVFNTRLNADLVVLSACQTGKGKLEKGEGVSGLYRAFLHAGSRSVLMSLWSINDKATAEFMKSFYGELAVGRSKSDALRETKLRMISSKYRNPFYWAAFVLNGEARSSIALQKPSLWDRIF